MSMEKSVTNWFDTEGYFHKDKFNADVKTLIESFESKKST